MEMMFLIVKLNYASIVIPEKYPKEQCLKIVEEINKTKYESICIPSPNIPLNCRLSKYTNIMNCDN